MIKILESEFREIFDQYPSEITFSRMVQDLNKLVNDKYVKSKQEAYLVSITTVKELDANQYTCDIQFYTPYKGENKAIIIGPAAIDIAVDSFNLDRNLLDKINYKSQFK